MYRKARGTGVPPVRSENLNPFGVQALACTDQCSLKAELRTSARNDAKFDHFVNFVSTKWT